MMNPLAVSWSHEPVIRSVYAWLAVGARGDGVTSATMPLHDETASMGPDPSSSAAAAEVSSEAAGAASPAPVVHDAAVVGGGPAGLTAGLHLAWHGRKVVVIDRTTGPLYFTLELLHNVPGMPAASGAEIQKRLRAQAREMGAELVRGDVVRIEGADGDFRLAGAGGEQWRARTLLVGAGGGGSHPTVNGDFTPCLAYAGKGTMFYCPDCEAPEVTGKDTL